MEVVFLFLLIIVDWFIWILVNKFLFVEMIKFVGWIILSDLIDFDVFWFVINVWFNLIVGIFCRFMLKEF